MRSFTEIEEATRVVVHEAVLRLPEGQLTIGDADSEVVVNDLASQTRVRVETDEVMPHGLSEVWINLVSAE